MSAARDRAGPVPANARARGAACWPPGYTDTRLSYPIGAVMTYWHDRETTHEEGQNHRGPSSPPGWIGLMTLERTVSRAEQDDIVWLATAPNEPIARMWAADLENEQIRVMLKPGGPGFGAWASAATFEHELFVRRADLAHARELLAELDDVDFSVPEDDDEWDDEEER